MCPYCGAPVSFRAPAKSAATEIATLNLKRGLPTVDEAMLRLDRELDAALAGGAKVVRIIHGWGSSGKGGGIRDEARRRLTVLLRNRRIGLIVHGEDVGAQTVAGRQLFARAPGLRETRSDHANPGITFVAR